MSIATPSARVGHFCLGNQLFDPVPVLARGVAHVLMVEDESALREFAYHKQKVAFTLATMRAHAELYRAAGAQVHYEHIDAHPQSFVASLLAWVRVARIAHVLCYEIEDRGIEAEILHALAEAGISHEVMASPMFLTSRAQFKQYLGRVARPFMRTFYEAQRRRLGLLMGADGRPAGGQWSYDAENRRALPASVLPPPLPPPEDAPEGRAHAEGARISCRAHFAEHVGEDAPLWLPVTRAGAQRWLQRFVHERLETFGPYEDALTERSDALYHGVLTPFLNSGLLTPDDVLRAVRAHAARHEVPLASLEGFVRQIIGWREFIRGIDRNFGAAQAEANFFGHHRRLGRAFYDGDSGVPPLDAVVKKVQRMGYAHHIERLMVAGSLMLLLEVHPHEAYRWFMEMFIDASHWVMGPNVFGMALFSDGGIFATKPYICASNYYRKMGPYRRGPWCDGVDGLYWRFIGKHRAFLLQNRRAEFAVRALDRMDPGRLEHITHAADELQQRITLPPA